MTPRRPRPAGWLHGRFWVPVAVVVLLAVAVVAFLADGARGPSGTSSQQLQSWVSGSNLGQDIGTLSADSRNVSRALAAHQGTTAIHTVCEVLAQEAQTANQNLPSPDTRVTDSLAKAFTLEYDAGQACYRAGATGHALLAESAKDRLRAGQLFEQVLQRVAAMTGRPVPTTTTTVPGGGTGTTFL